MGSESIILKTTEEIGKLRNSNVIVAEILAMLRDMVRPGITTMDLEKKCEEQLKKTKAAPAFKGYRGFPFCLCTSVNSEVVHGMPSDGQVLKEGDLLSIDFGVCLDGFYGDSAITVGVGTIDPAARKLMDVTAECLERAIEVTRVGKRLYDISHAVHCTVANLETLHTRSNTNGNHGCVMDLRLRVRSVCPESPPIPFANGTHGYLTTQITNRAKGGTKYI